MQHERLQKRFRQQATRTRGGKPEVDTRIMVPWLGDKARGHYTTKETRTGVPRKGHCRLQCPTKLPTGWHSRGFDHLSGAGLARILAFFNKERIRPARETAVADLRRALEAWCSSQKTPQAQTFEAWSSRTGTFHAPNCNTALPHFLNTPQPKRCCSASPRPIFHTTPCLVVRGRIAISMRGQAMMTDKAQRFKSIER